MSKISYKTIKNNTRLSEHKPQHKVHFDEASHTYTFKGKVLTSVTQFLSRYKQKFDEEKWSKYVSRRDKIPVALVKEQWDTKRDNACDLGTNVHMYAEYVINTLMDKPFDKPKAINNKAVRMMKQLDKLFYQQAEVKPLQSELLVFNEQYRIAGTIDFIYKDTKGNIYLADWKTNDKIKQENKYQKMKAPFSELDDCNYNHYALQLNLYKILYEQQTGNKVRGLFVIHIKQDAYDVYPIRLHQDIIQQLKNEVEQFGRADKD